MRLDELASRATPGMMIGRRGSNRIFKFSDGKKPYLLVDHYGNAAALFSDDLAADDWAVGYVWNEGTGQPIGLPEPSEI